MKKLTDIEISFISLVKNPANKKGLIFKSAETKEPDFQKEVVLKSLSKEGVAYGIVYSPYEVDSQGEWSDEEEIKKAAHNFMKNKNIANVDTEHSFINEKAYICESWIIKNDNDIFTYSRGAWAVGIKIDDDELKELITKGQITGLSMAGFAKKTEHELNEAVNLSKGVQMPQIDELIAKNKELEAIIKSKGDEAAAIIKSKDEKIAELQNEVEAKNSEISELKKSHKADIVGRLVKSGDMLPARKETAVSLEGKAFDDYCEMCQSEAKSVLSKSKFDGDEPKKDDTLDPNLAKQMDLKI